MNLLERDDVMKKVRSILRTMGVFMLILALAACGSSDPQTPINDSDSNDGAQEEQSNGDEGGDAEEVTLTVLAGQSTTDAGIEDMIDEALATAYPNITLEWETVDWGTAFQPKMQQYMQTELPDIMIGKAQDVGTYASLGILGEIDDTYLDRGLDAARTNVTVDGKTYGLVYNALYQGVYYNKAMFAENGWEIPKTIDDLNAIIADCESKGIIPFASHMIDTWSIGNVTMQFAMNDVFNHEPEWGDKFRAGEVSFTDSDLYQTAYGYNELIFNNTFEDTFSTEQTECDARFVQGEAAMKVSGSWSIQNFLAIDENFDFGIFPFPNQTGDAKLIFEPNITVMTSAESEKQDAINAVLDVMTGDKALATSIYDFTKTAPMLKDVTTTYADPSQEDVTAYAAENMIVDVTLGNNQLVWGGFQDENAKDIAAWLLGEATFEDALKASDSRVNVSSTN